MITFSNSFAPSLFLFGRKGKLNCQWAGHQVCPALQGPFLGGIGRRAGHGQAMMKTGELHNYMLNTRVINSPGNINYLKNLIKQMSTAREIPG